MNRESKLNGVCQITKKEFPMNNLTPANALSDSIVQQIKKYHPDFEPNGYISNEELNKHRNEYVKGIMQNESRELSHLEEEVMNSIRKSELLAKNINKEVDEKLTFGERTADKVALFGGSWKFIITFLVFMLIWILINVFVLLTRAFDPYPFILLNLILSCVASLQAPVIMMSQNRQEVKDRIHSEHDYQINLKAELEIRQLHEKMDHLLIQQGQRMMEIQQIQIELMEQIISQTKK